MTSNKFKYSIKNDGVYNVYFTAKEGKKEIGWLIIHHQGNIDIALSTIVDENYRRKGIMTNLMRMAFSHYKSANKTIHSSRILEEDEKKFYESLENKGYIRGKDTTGKRYLVDFSHDYILNQYK